METKALEIRDDGSFIPVICIRPVPANEEQRYLLRRDGYRGDATESCVIVVKAQCEKAAYDPYDWTGPTRTMRVAHAYIEQHWAMLQDGDVVDVQFLLGETTVRKTSERITAPL